MTFTSAPPHFFASLPPSLAELTEEMCVHMFERVAKWALHLEYLLRVYCSHRARKKKTHAQLISGETCLTARKQHGEYKKKHKHMIRVKHQSQQFFVEQYNKFN